MQELDAERDESRCEKGGGFPTPSQERGTSWRSQESVAATLVFIRAHAKAVMKVCGDLVSRMAIMR